MQTMVKLRAYRKIAWMMITIAAAPYLSAGAWAAERVISAPQSIVVFPLDAGAAVTDSRIVSELNAFLKDGLAANPRYRSVTFSERLPAVQRLVLLQSDKKTATQGPFATDAAAIGRAGMLAKAMSADVYVVGSIDRYAFDASVGTADVSGKAKLYDGRTGRFIREVPFQSHAVKPASETGASETKVRSAAVNDAGRKLVKGITGDEYQEPRPVTTTMVAAEKSSKKSSWIPALLLALGVGVLLGGSGGGSSSGGGTTSAAGVDNPPPPPF